MRTQTACDSRRYRSGHNEEDPAITKPRRGEEEMIINTNIPAIGAKRQVLPNEPRKNQTGRSKYVGGFCKNRKAKQVQVIQSAACPADCTALQEAFLPRQWQPPLTPPTPFPPVSLYLFQENRTSMSARTPVET